MENNIVVQVMVGRVKARDGSLGEEIELDGRMDVARYGGPRPKVDEVLCNGNRIALIQSNVLMLKRILTKPTIDEIYEKVNAILAAQGKPLLEGTSELPVPEKLKTKQKKERHL